MKAKTTKILLLCGLLLSLVWVGVKVTGDIKDAWSWRKDANSDVQNYQPKEPNIETSTAYDLDDLLNAIEWVESKGDANAMGDWQTVGATDSQWQTHQGTKTAHGYPGGEVYYGIAQPQAIGAYQIHKIYVDDVNRILASVGLFKEQFTYSDRWDKDKSRQMVTIYLRWYWNHREEAKKFPIKMSSCDTVWYRERIRTPEHESYCWEIWESCARIHNGGPNGWKKESTKKYWLKVKARLETQ